MHRHMASPYCPGPEQSNGRVLASRQIVIMLAVPLVTKKAAMAEWLRRLTRNQLGTPRAGSSPVRCESIFCLRPVCALHARADAPQAAKNAQHFASVAWWRLALRLALRGGEWLPKRASRVCTGAPHACCVYGRHLR